MKSNVFDIRTKEKVFNTKPRNTLPGGLFLSMNDLISSITIDGPRRYLIGVLGEYMENLRVPLEDLGTLIFVFDRKNSKTFLVKDLKDKADDMFKNQVMFE